MKVNSYKLNNGIAVTLHCSDELQSAPVVILCHGFCGIQDILLPAFAEAFTKAGLAVVTFDYLGFGASEGERGRLIPALQIANIVSVIDWVKTLEHVDITSIGLWGTSLGGGHVFGAAVQRPEVKCIVSQLGFADGEGVVTDGMTVTEIENFIATLDRMAAKRESTGKEMFVPVTRVLSDEESKRFFEENKVKYPALDIKIPFLTIRETLQYKPATSAAQVKCPVMVVVASNDMVNPPKQGVALYDAVGSEVKMLIMEEGANHYEMYAGKHFDNIITHQINWFKTYLCA